MEESFKIDGADGKTLLYVPMAGTAFFLSGEEVADLQKAASGLPTTDEAIEAWRMLQDGNEDVLECASPENISEMTILLNQKCNFSCSYCYSARGRSNAELSKEQLQQALSFFVSKKRGPALRIVFSGGGDPMLSFTKIKEAVETAENLAQNEKVAVSFGLVTNGSTLEEEHVSFLKKHDVDMVLSFDIIKEVHNQQRSNYDMVAATLRRMAAAGLTFGLRCTITQQNVERMEEMVKTLHADFPEVRSAAFEAVLSNSLFKDDAALDTFYQQFVSYFFKARDEGAKWGVEIGNTVVNSVGTCKRRACIGKLVVTPEGKLTACSRISMPKENYFNLFHYGQISADGVMIDHQKYQLLMDDNVDSHSECADCIARWHCGGGCLLARNTLGKRMTSYCNFMRKMVIETLKTLAGR